jgi:hypothetical protein
MGKEKGRLKILSCASLQSLHRHQLRTGRNYLQRTLDARHAPLCR